MKTIDQYRIISGDFTFLLELDFAKDEEGKILRSRWLLKRVHAQSTTPINFWPTLEEAADAIRSGDTGDVDWDSPRPWERHSQRGRWSNTFTAITPV